ncbi:MAG: type II toxin-antitoxin system HipA family toxin [Bradyrhizobium sp.]|nr:type II toxin-antitoxin system HipA family toxin [Bradyrhizobium sp.]
MIRSLSVWWDRRLVGALCIDQHGDLGFNYDQAWLDETACPPISQSLPKQAEPFNRHATRPFFAGLLPEESQREAVARALGISRANDFRLLEALGGDVAGALTLWPEGEAPPSDRYEAADFRPLRDAELIEILDTLPRRPMLAGREGLRLSLAGAQQKLPVVVVDGHIGLPLPGQPTTHILKPPISRFNATTENEAFAMRLAEAVKLPVASVEPRRVGARSFLLVERYDRATGADGLIHRLHQEDFCQALGITPEHKYAGEGGPVFKTCFDLIRRACTTPAPAVLRLLDAAIFNAILGNADAHGKNFSLLYTKQGVEFAPLYDLLCTVAYPDLSAKFSMKIAKRATLAEFKPDTWEEFAKDIGVGAPYTRRRVTALAHAIVQQAPLVAAALADAGFDREALDTYTAIVTNRAAPIA